MHERCVQLTLLEFCFQRSIVCAACDPYKEACQKMRINQSTVASVLAPIEATLSCEVTRQLA